MSEDWAAVALEVEEALLDVGFAATIIAPGAETGPEYDPTLGADVEYPVTVIDSIIRRRDVNGLETHTTRVLTVAANGVTPVKGWHVSVRGVTHRIVEVMPLAPGGVDLLFKLELGA